MSQEKPNQNQEVFEPDLEKWEKTRMQLLLEAIASHKENPEKGRVFIDTVAELKENGEVLRDETGKAKTEEYSWDLVVDEIQGDEVLFTNGQKFSLAEIVGVWPWD